MRNTQGWGADRRSSALLALAVAWALILLLLLAPSAVAQAPAPAEPPVRLVRIPGTAPNAIPFTLTIPMESPTLVAGDSAANLAEAQGYYVVRPGDTLFVIARDLGVDMHELAALNAIVDINRIEVGQVLQLPGATGRGEQAAARPQPAVVASDIITARMTVAAQQASPTSPYYNSIWLTYYGRPGIPIMGILGTDDPITVTALLREQAARYDAANGPDLSVRPAFHLVYGMATKRPGDDGMHLNYLADDIVMQYIEIGRREGIDVILDIQIGAYTPAESTRRALPFLEYPNVHLAIDPEFAMTVPGQAWPGNPIGYVTAEQVNEVQRVMAEYLREREIAGTRILLVHQFQQSMIENKEDLDSSYPEVALTLSVDGFGSPYAKITKYNALVDDSTPFTAFKLFYDWDVPLLNERQALGSEPGLVGYSIGVTPNMIIYQ